MKNRLHRLLAVGLGAMSMGAEAAVHDWTATRIGNFDADVLAAVDMNDSGQVLVSRLTTETDFSQRALLYTPGGLGGLVDLGSLGGIRTAPRALNALPMLTRLPAP